MTERACESIWTPLLIGRKRPVSPCFPSSCCSPVSGKRAPARIAGPGTLWHSHLCPCFISSACLPLTFYPACILQPNFRQARERAQGFLALLAPLCVWSIDLTFWMNIHMLWEALSSAASFFFAGLSQLFCWGRMPGIRPCGAFYSFVTWQQVRRSSFYLELVKCYLAAGKPEVKCSWTHLLFVLA